MKKFKWVIKISKCIQANIAGVKLKEKDFEDLRFAKSILENPSLAMRIMNVLGKPFGKGLMILPDKWSGHIKKITETVLHAALSAALVTMSEKEEKKSSELLHKVVVAASGGVGGVFGLPALSIELPISTTIMLRSIADIARSEGESINDIETKLACIEVFALGGRAPSDDESEVGYYAIRTALTKAISDAAKYISQKGIVEKGAPILVRLIAMIASRFGVAVSEKMAASAIPIVGAAGGAMINTIFINHFQDMARGHFIIRRLERVYGKEKIELTYQNI